MIALLAYGSVQQYATMPRGGPRPGINVQNGGNFRGNSGGQHSRFNNNFVMSTLKYCKPINYLFMYEVNILLNE